MVCNQNFLASDCKKKEKFAISFSLSGLFKLNLRDEVVTFMFL